MKAKLIVPGSKGKEDPLAAFYLIKNNYKLLYDPKDKDYPFYIYHIGGWFRSKPPYYTQKLRPLLRGSSS